MVKKRTDSIYSKPETSSVEEFKYTIEPSLEFNVDIAQDTILQNIIEEEKTHST
jgi:hypothetical protein